MRETEWNGSEKDGEYMQTDRRDRLRRLLIRSTELEIAVGIHWPELWGGLAALWATIGSLGMFPPLFLPTTPLTVYTEYTGIVIQTRICRAVGVLIVVGSRTPRSTYFSFTCNSTSLHILAAPSMTGDASPLVHVRFLSRCWPRSSDWTRYQDSLRDDAGIFSLSRNTLLSKWSKSGSFVRNVSLEEFFFVCVEK